MHSAYKKNYIKYQKYSAFYNIKQLKQFSIMFLSFKLQL